MKYRFVTEKSNYEDYAAGRVLYSQAGMTSFPVRLASEIFQRCAEHLDRQSLRVYDPCGGSAYLLTVIGFLHSDRIASLFSSDIRLPAATLANRNLSLLTESGLEYRQQEIESFYQAYGKDSHADALASVDILKTQVPKHEIQIQAWVGDAMQPALLTKSVDVLISDVPYGDVVNWHGVNSNPIQQLLEANFHVLKPSSVVAIISDKKQKASHPRYRRISYDTIGKRRVTFLQPINSL